MSRDDRDRAAYSRTRLAELHEGVADLHRHLDEAAMCVYATGSYGRLEAYDQSDIDLFFLFAPTPEEKPRVFLPFLRLAGRLVEVTERMGFPPFSGDGRFLETLDVVAMERQLGSPADDSTNTFTARMLLLLESQPVTDPERYAEFLRRVVGFYYRDYAGHEDDFVPTFLTNDILRFWRTLTLNYEHDRYQAGALADASAREAAMVKSALKNYKLKVSRLSTCFSMIVHLACSQPPVTLDQVVGLCNLTPRERFAALVDHRPHDPDRGDEATVEALVGELEAVYEAFLERVQRPEEELLEAFAERGYRKDRLREAAAYGDRIFDLLDLLVPPHRLRHLVV
ncbi:MAG: DUF294 nucleotidyltransferase-like domain-containing protein [Baekduia sp.]